MKKLLFILLLIPFFSFSQGEVKLLKVNESHDYPGLELGNFSFSGNAMYIDLVRSLYKEVDTLRIGLQGSVLTTFESAIKPGNTTDNTPGSIRYTGTDLQGYVDGEWVSLSTPAIYEEELTGVKTVFSLGFKLKENTLIFFNGQALSDNQWTGEGTTTLTLLLDTDQYDKLIVKQ